MATLREYVELAADVYTSWVEAGGAPDGWRIQPGMFIDDAPFWTPGARFGSSGLQCRAYRRERGNEVVIAYKGTKPTMLSDLRADAGITFYVEPVQMKEALRNTQRWLGGLRGVARISLTGHSLGGAIAQYVGSHTGKQFVTFNAPGMLANTSGLCASPWIDQNLKKGTNYIMLGDAIGNFGRHIGDTVRINRLGLARVALAGVASALTVGSTALGSAAASLGQHGIANFREYLEAGDPRFDPDDDPLA